MPNHKAVAGRRFQESRQCRGLKSDIRVVALDFTDRRVMTSVRNRTQNARRSRFSTNERRFRTSRAPLPTGVHTCPSERISWAKCISKSHFALIRPRIRTRKLDWNVHVRGHRQGAAEADPIPGGEPKL